MKTIRKSQQSCRIRAPKRTIKATITDSTRIAKVTTLNGGSGGVNISAGNTINLEAPKISGSSLNLSSGTTNSDGKVNLIAAIDSLEVSRTVTSRNTFWQSNQSTSSLNQTLHMTNIKALAVSISTTGEVQGIGEQINLTIPEGILKTMKYVTALVVVADTWCFLGHIKIVSTLITNANLLNARS